MFDIPLPVYFLTKEHPLKTSNKRTHIHLFTHIYLDIHLLNLFF